MRTFVLQPWITLGLTDFVQGAEGWLDLLGYSDVILWIDVASSSASLTVTFETSPSWDDAYFQPMGAAITVQPGTTTVYRGTRCLSTVPLARWLRWNATGSSGSVTFRIRVSASRQLPFVPPDVQGCVLWLRSDLGLTFWYSPDQYVQTWADQSLANDPNHSPSQGGEVVLTESDPFFNGWPSLYSQGGQLGSGTWAAPLQQPSTWVVVADGASSDGGLIGSNDLTTGQLISYSGSTLSMSANGGSVSATVSWGASDVSAVLGEWNGGNSNLYFNNFTTPLASGTVGGGSAGSQGSLTVLGNNSDGPWQGSVAEVIGFSGILTPSQKGQLRLYLNNRYDLSIT